MQKYLKFIYIFIFLLILIVIAGIWLNESIRSSKNPSIVDWDAEAAKNLVLNNFFTQSPLDKGWAFSGEDKSVQINSVNGVITIFEKNKNDNVSKYFYIPIALNSKREYVFGLEGDYDKDFFIWICFRNSNKEIILEYSDCRQSISNANEWLKYKEFREMSQQLESTL